MISHVTYTTATIVVPDSVNTFTVELQRNVQLLPEIDLREYPNGFVMENAKEKDLKKFPVKADSLIVVEFNAGFPYEGGINTFYDFFGNTFKFPEKELLEKEEGKVLIGFTIDKNGDYQNVHCPIGQGSKLCEEFKRILTELPKWTPGEQRGDPVEQSFAMFVRYGMNAYWERKIRN